MPSTPNRPTRAHGSTIAGLYHNTPTAVIERELGRCRELLEIAEKPAERKCTYDLADPLVESLPRC